MSAPNRKGARRFSWDSSDGDGFTQVALRFAGPDGVLLRIALAKDSRSRDIRKLSAIVMEDEVMR